MNPKLYEIVVAALGQLALTVFWIGLLLYIRYMVFGRHLGNRRSPIAIIADSAARVVDRNWRRLAQSPSASPPDKVTVDRALEYLRTARLIAIRTEYEERRQQIEHEHRSTIKTFEHKELPSWVVRLAQASVELIESLLLATAVVIIPIAFVWAATQFPAAVLGIVFVFGALFLVNHYASSVEPRWRPQEAFAYGSGYFVKRSWNRPGAELAEAEKIVLTLMEGLSESAAPQPQHEDDPDLLRVQKGDKVALAPGFSELVFSATDATINEIRKNLIGVRRQHRLFSWLSFLSFLGVIGVTVFGIVFRGIQAGPQLLGGGGISLLLATFCFVTLQNLRTSQIALALFTSYVAELHEDLAYAERQEEHGRQRLRSKAWQNFRKGINDLWLQERSSPPLLPKSKRSSD